MGFRFQDWDHCHGRTVLIHICLWGDTWDICLRLFSHSGAPELTAAPGDGDDILGRGRAAVDLPILNAALGLGEVFKGAVNSCREVWDIPGLQDQLGRRGKSINTEN